MMTYYLFLFLGIGALMIAVSIPLILGRVPPNRWYGFRVRRTLEDEHVWYAANCFTAWRMARLGGIAMAAAVVCYLLPGMEFETYAGIMGALLGLGVVLTMIQSFIFLSKLTSADSIKPLERRSQQ